VALFTRVFVDEGRSPNVVDALYGNHEHEGIAAARITLVPRRTRRLFGE